MLLLLAVLHQLQPAVTLVVVSAVALPLVVRATLVLDEAGRSAARLVVVASTASVALAAVDLLPVAAVQQLLVVDQWLASAVQLQRAARAAVLLQHRL